jgi:Fur family ferric uptake transcriptional regulator
MDELRMTSQRKIILEALSQSRSHPPADDIYDYVRSKLPDISLGTVYRNLETMHRYGMIVKIETPDGQKRFDYDTSSHPHFRCENCGKIEDIPLDLSAPEPDPANEWVKERTIKSSTLHYQGLCSDCSK